MNVLVFKTNLGSSHLIKWIAPYFSSHPCISEWSVDTEDVDNIFRVVSLSLIDKNVIQLMLGKGFECEALRINDWNENEKISTFKSC